eukprot:2979308-Pyramimonas_sp.AAC.1
MAMPRKTHSANGFLQDSSATAGPWQAQISKLKADRKTGPVRQIGGEPLSYVRRDLVVGRGSDRGNNALGALEDEGRDSSHDAEDAVGGGDGAQLLQGYPDI